jgi:malate dehydrogenase
MSTISIIGAGDVGGAVAHALARGERVARVLLIDASGKAAAGKALDIQQAGGVEHFHTRVEGSDDPARAAGSAVCVIADRFGHLASEWEGDDGLHMIARLATEVGDAPFVFAGAHQGPLLLAASREAGIRRDRLIGSAPEALASAVRAIVAMEARCSSAEVALTVLGTPPSGFVVPWSEASIGGLSAERVLSQVQLNRLEARAGRLWPPGPFAMGLAAARVVEAAVGSSRRSHTVLTVLTGEFGVRHTVGALPVLLAPAGIVHTRVPQLNTRERVRLGTALGA